MVENGRGGRAWRLSQMSGTWRKYQRMALRAYESPACRCVVALAIILDFASRCWTLVPRGHGAAEIVPAPLGRKGVPEGAVNLNPCLEHEMELSARKGGGGKGGKQGGGEDGWCGD